MLFPFEYTLCLTEEQFRDSLKSFGVKDIHDWEFMKDSGSNATAHFVKNYNEAHAVIVCVRNHEKYNLVQMHGLIVHEAVHVFQQFCVLIGEDTPSSEFQAYGIQSIAQGLMAEYERQTKCAA